MQFYKYTHTHTHTHTQVSLIPPWEDQCEWHRMTRMTGPDCAVMCNLINTHTHTQTQREDQREWHIMTRMTRPDCAVMCNLINTHTHTHTHTHTQQYIPPQVPARASGNRPLSGPLRIKPVRTGTPKTPVCTRRWRFGSGRVSTGSTARM